MSIVAAKLSKEAKSRSAHLKVIHKDPLLKKISVYQKFYKSDVVLIASARAGISSHAISDFIDVSGKPVAEVASLLYVTGRTVRNYQNENKNLPVLQSEQLLKLYSIYDKGLEAFGTREAFNRWLSKPAFGLSNQVPDSLLLTSTGIRMVLDELQRIVHGDFA